MQKQLIPKIAAEWMENIQRGTGLVISTGKYDLIFEFVAQYKEDLLPEELKDWYEKCGNTFYLAVLHGYITY